MNRALVLFVVFASSAAVAPSQANQPDFRLQVVGDHEPSGAMDQTCSHRGWSPDSQGHLQPEVPPESHAHLAGVYDDRAILRPKTQSAHRGGGDA